MKKYIVRIQSPDVRNELAKHFENVGIPKAIHKTIIIETNKSKDEIVNFPGVLKVNEDIEIDFAEIQESPENWALPKICNEEENYIYDRTGENVDIYIADTGIRTNHDEFKDENGISRVTTIFAPDGKDFDPDQDSSPRHGTVCASQSSGNKCGVAKKSNIFNARVFGTGSSAVKALDKILEHHLNKNNNNPSIINMSFGAKSETYLGDETKELVENGIICVACAHNYSEEISTAPAIHPWVISVGATTKSNCIAMFSNYGETVNILAPGQSLYGAVIDNDNSYYDNLSGTSYSSPLVAGVLALIVENGIIKNEEDVNKATKILYKYANEHIVINIDNQQCWTGHRPNTTNKFLFSLVENETINNKPDKDYYITSVSNCATIIYRNENGNVYDTLYGADALDKIEDKYDVKIEDRHYDQNNFLVETDFIIQKGRATYHTPGGGKHTVYGENAEEILRETYKDKLKRNEILGSISQKDVDDLYIDKKWEDYFK